MKDRSLYAELKRRHVFKVAAAYLVVAWVLIQVASVISGPMSLPAWFEPVVLALLVLGFPVALVLAWAFDLKPGVAPSSSRESVGVDTSPARRVSNIALAVVGVWVIVAVVWWFAGTDERRARTEGIAELDEYIALGDWDAAYRAAAVLEEIIPGDRELAERHRQYSWRATLVSEPAGAKIYRRPYRSAPDDWQFIGNAPLEDIRIPFGFSIVRAELDSYDTVQQVVGGHLHLTEELTTQHWQSKGFDLAPEFMRLDRIGTLPAGTVRVPGWRQEIDGESISFNDFFLDRHEVTNLEYKEFVDAGGYDRPEFWVDDIVGETGPIPWAAAVPTFVDSTGRAGPSTWVAGDFPDGEDDHPVGGVSWYEAAAYARFRGRQLPTVHHWRRAFAPGIFAAMLPESNLASDASVPVGTTQSISWAGNLDMAGNVREWVFNEAGGRRFALGGAWNDDSYRATNQAYTQVALDRDPGNGIRLALLRDEPGTISAARAPVAPPITSNMTAAAQVPDEVFEAYRTNFEYDRTPLNASVRTVDSGRLMMHELVEIDAAYGPPRLPIHLYLPTNASPPFQIVVYWPGSIIQELANYDDFKFQFDFLLKSGRAVAFPVYYSAFDRWESGSDRKLDGIAAQRDRTIRTVKDLRRAIDYLETRPDIDIKNIGLFGNSWGARNGAIALALDSRFRAAVLYTLTTTSRPRPDIDSTSYLTRILTPVLMISGEYDPFVLLQDARTALGLIGTADSDKRLVIAPGGHYAPYGLLVQESLAWYDRYLGVPGKR